MEAIRVCVLSTLCLALVFIMTEAHEKGKCENMDIQLTEEHMMKLSECVKEVGAESWGDLAKDKLPCFGKCVITKRNLVDAAGLPHVENIVMAVNSSMPETVRGDLVAGMEACLNEHASKVDPKEEKCESYAPLLDCMHVSFVEVCNKQ